MITNLMRAYAELVNADDESLRDLGTVVVDNLPQTVTTVTVGDYLRIAARVGDVARRTSGNALAADVVKIFARCADTA